MNRITQNKPTRRDFLIGALGITAIGVLSVNSQTEEAIRRQSIESIAKQVDECIGNDKQKALDLIDLTNKYIDEGKPIFSLLIIQFFAVVRYKILAEGTSAATSFVNEASLRNKAGILCKYSFDKDCEILEMQTRRAANV